MRLLLLALVSLLTLAWPGDALRPDQAPGAAVRPPNFIIIYADDLGYADIGPFSTKSGDARPRTPNLDRMAAEGIRLTNFYVAQAVCSASRAALLTGAYSNRVGIQGALNHTAAYGINPDEMTIAEVLKQRGYATAIYGKWHLGHHKQFLPVHHGFDEYFGLPYSNDMWPRHPQRKDFFPDLPLIDGDTVAKHDPDQSQLTTWYAEHAVRFIERNRDRPFFLYVPHTMPHVPLFVSDKFKGKTANGLYGDVIAELDWSVGQILDAVRRAKLDDATMVIFASDNGPWMSVRQPCRIARPIPREQGHDVRGRRARAVPGTLARTHSEGRCRRSTGDDDRPAADACGSCRNAGLKRTDHRRPRHLAIADQSPWRIHAS